MLTNPPGTPQTTLSSLSPAAAPRGAKLEFTEITGLVPNRLTKVIGVNAQGNLRKESTANLMCGKARRIGVNGLAGLRDHLDALTSAQAVAWGITREPVVDLCTNADEQAKAAGAIARTRENFHFAAGPGVFMLDHDGLPEGSLTADELRNRLLVAAPALAEAPMLWRPSASAGCLGPDGQVLTPLTRHRLYIPVQDATRIPEAGSALVDLLWACEGNGWIQVGNAGQALPRCLADTAVWQPERLDFAGPPVLQNGVTRPNAAGVIYGQADGLFDLRKLIDSATPAIRQDAEAARNAGRAAVKQQCAAQAERWAAERAPALAAGRGISPEKAFEILKRASRHNVLLGHFELTCEDGQVVTVAQLLNHKTRWNGARFADPLDPDHDQRVAVAHLLGGGRPNIYSHRHGGMHFELRQQSDRVQIGRGMRVESTDAVLRVLAERGELYDLGDTSVVHVTNGKASPVSLDWLIDHMGRAIDFYRCKAGPGADAGIASTQESPEDAPPYIASAILAKHGARGFAKLTAVCTAPTLRIDGSVLDKPGFDASTGLLYVTSEIEPSTVPDAPSIEMALDALAALWKPFQEFPLVDPVSTGVLLAACLSAPLRPSLPTCPAFGFDAPAAGTGKTLLAKCIGALAAGHDVAVLPPTKEEDECRKRLFAALRGGDHVLIWDNVREPLGNAVIDAFLTSPCFADRVLGVSENQQLPNKALFLVTGNNLALTGDTHRRVLVTRLDARMERPFGREFDRNPLDYGIENRIAMVIAALTIVRAYIHAGRPRSISGRMASFEDWDDLVRQPLIWLAKAASASGRTDLPMFADPMEAITRAGSENPEQTKMGALLETWHETFGSKPTTVGTAIAQDHYKATPLYDAIEEIAGQNGRINPGRLGRWLQGHVEQRCNGLRFVRAGQSHGVAQWQVLETRERVAANDAIASGPAGGLVGSGGFVSLDTAALPPSANAALEQRPATKRRSKTAAQGAGRKRVVALK